MFKWLFFSSFILWFHSNAQDTIKTNIVIDSLGNEVFLLVDNNQQPKSYFSPIYTPVCVDGSCYPINIELHWDLAGDYLQYTLPKDEILTKIEHFPFTDFDYGLLHRMISKSPSALEDFSIYNLTLPDQNKVDGITGATRLELSGSFVPDALFTTYTLWHLAKRPKKDIINFTKERYFTEEWAPFIMRSSVLECRKQFISQLLIDKHQSTQDELLFKLLNQYDSSFPIELIQKIDNNDFTKKQFVMLYLETNNDNLKSAILNRWKTTGIDKEELIALTTEIGYCSVCFNEELLLIEQVPIWPEFEYKLFYSKMRSQQNMIRREKMTKILEARVDSYPRKFRRTIKRST